MTRQSILTADDYHDFLFTLYFGPGNDDLERCVRGAYADLHRTIRGFGSFANRDPARAAAFDYVYGVLHTLPTTYRSTSQDAFDTWHEHACRNLIYQFTRHGWDQFYVGQAQKWFNMAFKYIYTFGEDRLPGYQSVYAFCHVPIDNIILEQLRAYGFSGIQDGWSRINNYEHYFQIQTWFRDTFDAIPLDAEFRLWQGQDVKLK